MKLGLVAKTLITTTTAAAITLSTAQLQAADQPTGILAFDTISTCHPDDVKYIYSGQRVDESLEDDSIYFLKMKENPEF